MKRKARRRDRFPRRRWNTGEGARISEAIFRRCGRRRHVPIGGTNCMVLPVLATTSTPSPGLVAAGTTALTLPWLLFSLPVGATVDRVDRKRMIIAVPASGLRRGSSPGSRSGRLRRRRFCWECVKPFRTPHPGPQRLRNPRGKKNPGTPPGGFIVEEAARSPNHAAPPDFLFLR